MSKHTSIFKIFISLLIAVSAIFFAQIAQANGERAPYGNNLLVNPNAETGDMTGWTILEDGGNGWSAVTNANTSLNSFQTSYGWAKREQIVNLMDMGFSAAILDKAPPILISEVFGKFYCADQYFLDIELLDANQQVLKTWSSGVREHENTVCESRTYQEFLEQKLSNYGAGVRYIRWRDGGKDTEYWGGHYGAQLENAYLAILPPNLLNNPGELSSWNVTDNGADGFSVTGPPEARQFITSYDWTSRQQTIDLVAQGYSAATLDESPPMMISGTYGTFFNCSDNYYLKAELLDVNQQVIKSWDSGERQHTGACDPNNPSYNETITAFLDYGPGVRFIRWEDGGKDTEYWSGHYGAVLQDPYVGLLLVPEVHSPDRGRRLSGSFLSDVAKGGFIGALAGGVGCALMTGGFGAPVCFALAGEAYATATVVGTTALAGASIGMAHYAGTDAHSTDDPSTIVHQYELPCEDSFINTDTCVNVPKITISEYQGSRFCDDTGIARIKEVFNGVTRDIFLKIDKDEIANSKAYKQAFQVNSQTPDERDNTLKKVQKVIRLMKNGLKNDYKNIVIKNCSQGASGAHYQLRYIQAGPKLWSNVVPNYQADLYDTGGYGTAFHELTHLIAGTVDKIDNTLIYFNDYNYKNYINNAPSLHKLADAYRVFFEILMNDNKIRYDGNNHDEL